MLALDFFDTPCCGESDDLVEGGGDCPHVVDPRSTEDHIVSLGAVEHYEGDMEVDSGYVNWESDVPQSELLFAAESD